MAIVTFISDFGNSDHYVAAVKAKILGENPGINIVDITHQIKAGDIGHASYVLKGVFRDFPEGTVHLVGVSNTAIKNPGMVAIKLEQHYFVGEDSGIYSLISEETPMAVVDLNVQGMEVGTFASRDILAGVCAKLASGAEIQDLGRRTELRERFVPTRAKATKEQIAGNVIRIDHYGNLITNILKSDFEAILKINKNCPFEVNFRREKVTQIHSHYNQVGSGECFVIFNSQGFMEIGVLQGRGTDLFGLELNNQVFVNFLLQQ